MKLYNVKLLTIICEIHTQKNIINILKKHKVTGYTTYEIVGNKVYDLHGKGLKNEKNVKFEVIMRKKNYQIL